MTEGKGGRPESAGNAPRGLVLAGGRSRRMGEDKGLIAYRGQPQVVWLSQLLLEFCASVHVSIGPRQQDSSCYGSLQTIIDREPGRGPAGGLMSAWELDPGAAWLLVAVDLPLLDPVTLGALTEGRSRRHLATAFRHPDGPLEPLCTIWEPAARSVLERRLARGGRLAAPAPGGGSRERIGTACARCYSERGFARGSKSRPARAAIAAPVVVSAE